MKSFFETPDKKKRQMLFIGDLSVITVNLCMVILMTMYSTGALDAMFKALGNLTSFTRVISGFGLALLMTGFLLAPGLLYIGVYYLSGLYRISVLQDLKKLWIRMLVAVPMAVLIVWLLAEVVSKKPYSPKIWFYHGLTLLAMVSVWRLLYHNRGKNKTPYRIQIIGGDEQSAAASALLSGNGSAPFVQLSTLSKEEFFKRLQNQNSNGKGSWDMIVYPFSDPLNREQLVSLIRKKFEGVRICDSLTFYKNCSGRFPVMAIDPKWLINLSISLSLKEGFQQRIKRMSDVLASGIGIVLTLPLMVIVAALVKLTSEGPALYFQERLGLYQKPFRLYKFRTMKADCEKSTGPIWACEDDPRLTPPGKFLRKTRLDELPQLFNILKGDMSLVGPRPIRKFFADRMAEKFPYYHLRFSIKPGLTGWAQVLGNYGDSEAGQLRKLEYELFYINEYSLALDAEILFRTVGKVLSGDGQ